MKDKKLKAFILNKKNHHIIKKNNVNIILLSIIKNKKYTGKEIHHDKRII